MEKKKTVKVSLKVKEIIFDVMNKTHLTGKSRMAEAAVNFEAGAHMQASEDNEHAYQIYRSVSNAFAHLKTEMGEYLSEDGSLTTNIVNKAVDNASLDEEGMVAYMEPVLKACSSSVTASDTALTELVELFTVNDPEGDTAVTYAELKAAYNKNIGHVKDAAAQAKIRQAWEEAHAVLVLKFLLPSNFNNAACDSLGGGLHEYVVDRAIFDWFSITNKPDAENYLTLSQAALESAKKALYKRERPTRPTYED